VTGIYTSWYRWEWCHYMCYWIYSHVGFMLGIQLLYPPFQHSGHTWKFDTVSKNTSVVVKIPVHHSVKYISKSLHYWKCSCKFRSPQSCMKLLCKIKMAFRHEPCCVLLTNLFNWLILIKLGVKYKLLLKQVFILQWFF
jgi:hypothetical protein